MFNRRLEARLKQSSLSNSSAKRRGCGTMTTATKGRRSTVMNDVRNVQNSINLLNNLVTTKRSSQQASRDIMNKIPGPGPSLGVVADNGISDPCEPLVKLVPFIDPVLPYRTSSPCRSNFRTLSTITQFRRSVSLNRVNMTPSLGSVNMSDSMFSLTDIRPPSREERPSKLSPSSFVSRDPDARHHLDCNRSQSWSTADPLDTMSLPLPEPPATKPEPAQNSAGDTASCTSHVGSPGRNRRRLFNRKVAGSVSDSQPTSQSSFDTQTAEEDDVIEKVCIERWLCGLPGESPTDGNSMALSIRGLGEEETVSSSQMSTPISLERSFSEDGFLCNCEFGGSHECCIFHNSSLGSTSAGLPVQRSATHHTTPISKSRQSANNHINSSQKHDRQSKSRDVLKKDSKTESNETKRLSGGDKTDNITDLLSVIDLGLDTSSDHSTCSPRDHSTCSDVKNHKVLGTSNLNHTGGDDSMVDGRNTIIPVQTKSGEGEKYSGDEITLTKSSVDIADVQGSGKFNIDTRQVTDQDCSESSATSATTHTLVTCEPQIAEPETVPPGEVQGTTRLWKDKEISSLPSEPATVAPVPKYLSVQCSLGEIPNARSPCAEDFDKFSEDSFFTESDSNSLIGGIIRDMVGV